MTAEVWHGNDSESHWWLMLAPAKISEQEGLDVPVTELSAPHALCPPSTQGCQDCAHQVPVRTTTAATWRTLGKHGEAMSVRIWTLLLVSFLINLMCSFVFFHLATCALKLIAPQDFVFAYRDILFIRVHVDISVAALPEWTERHRTFPKIAYCIFM